MQVYIIQRFSKVFFKDFTLISMATSGINTQSFVANKMKAKRQATGLIGHLGYTFLELDIGNKKKLINVI